MKTDTHLWSFPAQLFLEWEMFQTKRVDKIRTYIAYSVAFFKKNLTVYEIIWKNNVEPGRPQMNIWYMCIVLWIPEGANTPSEYVIIIAFPQQE